MEDIYAFEGYKLHPGEKLRQSNTANLEKIEWWNWIWIMNWLFSFSWGLPSITYFQTNITVDSEYFVKKMIDYSKSLLQKPVDGIIIKFPWKMTDGVFPLYLLFHFCFLIEMIFISLLNFIWAHIYYNIYWIKCALKKYFFIISEAKSPSC